MPTFSREQICEILVLACESPNDDGLPATCWAYATLAAEATARGIVTEISAHSIGRFLRVVDLKLHRTRGCINSPRDAQFEDKCRDVCETHRSATELAALGIQTGSTEKIVGVQAIK